MKKLNRYIVVSFHSAKQAQRAFEDTLASFDQTLPMRLDLSRVEGNTVYYMCTKMSDIDHAIEHFLLAQDGAQPKGCHCH